MKNKNLFITFIVLGIWVFVSPWVLGFSGLELALWSNIFSGTIVVVLTLWIWLNESEEKN
ncbi:MAG: SPW repeat protein [Candidatus Pacebacteria bacterium]|nr:SPW repeat protein [Candidatus Paceibacterota bacterium]